MLLTILLSLRLWETQLDCLATTKPSRIPAVPRQAPPPLDMQQPPPTCDLLLQLAQQRLLGGDHHAVHHALGHRGQQLGAHDLQVGADMVADALQVRVRGRHAVVALFQQQLAWGAGPQDTHT